MQPKYLNTSYLFFSLRTLIYSYAHFFFFKCCLVFKLPVGNISIPHKLGFSEISPPQSLLSSCMLILNLMLNNLFITFFILLVIYSVWHNNKIKNNKIKISR